MSVRETADRFFQTQIKRVLHYDPLTGIWTWLNSGQRADHLHSGYWFIEFQGIRYSAHRLAFVYKTAKWPLNDVDHRDRAGGSNRWSNIRPATRSQNSGNSRKRSNNTSGFKGVSKKRNRFQAYITCAGKRHHLGIFDTAAEAHQVYCRAADKYFGEFARYA